MSKPFEPFCTAILRTLRRSLLPPNLPRPLPAHTHFPASSSSSSSSSPSSSSSSSSSSSPSSSIDGSGSDRGNTNAPKESAILIPLMNIRDEPHILMEVRNKSLRVHAGEISFPGGKADKSDESLIHTALRETQEELSIPPSHVEILGMLEPAYSLGNKSRVWPFVGFIHSDPQPFPSIPQTLPSLPLDSIIPNPEEVSSIVSLPLSALRDPSKLSIHYFRLDLGKPYYRIDATDHLLPKRRSDKRLLPNQEAPQEGPIPTPTPAPVPTPAESHRVVGVEENGEYSQALEVWGLSGWFLNKLAERAGWLDPPPKGEPVD
ncbi:uncharacterized protein I303_102090 [Kwoniella dejecticola CBS 10117]|uniref:Nudix hydrolase domain-containing protein n=1 Tax=Kwoniella dejecticola CBS 10117 TaxID=1296121 RepID=A0A1A6ABW6_9TREE|nr:uncharacterized protein I303_01769 [Kwoniella dejecticola CBS 10117]OBR87561.1 hypothetical protein I303_01769 [Kwoniella dejecticola CBS 10117]